MRASYNYSQHFLQPKEKREAGRGEKISTVLLFSVHTNTKKKNCVISTPKFWLCGQTPLYTQTIITAWTRAMHFFMSKIHQQLLEEGKKKTAGCHFSITIGPKIWVLVNVPTFWIYAHILVFIQLGFCIVLFLNVWNEGYASRLIWTRQVALQPCRSAVIENVSARGCSGAVLNDEILG